MESNLLQADLIVRYLLGDLPEAEQARLEDRAFADREYLQTIEDAENDLIDEYVRGALTANERRQFESRFLASAERQRKVEFARALAQVAPAATTEKAAQPMRWLDALRAFLSGLTPTFQFGLAAAALLLAFGVPWLIAQTIGLRAQVTELQAQHSSSAQALAEQQRRNEELARQLQGEQQRLAQWQEDAVKPPASSPVIASLMLLPGLPRGAGKLPQLLIPHGAQQARLQVGLERGDDYKSYRVELRTRAGQEVARRNNLTARSGRAGREVVLLVSVNLLNPGEYELALKGGTGGNQMEDIGYYYFSVLKK